MLKELGKWFTQKNAYNKYGDLSSNTQYSPNICALGVVPVRFKDRFCHVLHQCVHVLTESHDLLFSHRSKWIQL